MLTFLEYLKEHKQNYNKAFEKLRTFNSSFTKKYKNQIRADRDARFNNKVTEGTHIHELAVPEKDIIAEAIESYLTEGDDYLYHATFRSHKPSITKSGLSANPKQRSWSDSQKGRVYLAKDPDVALSYAETAEDAPEHHYNSGFVVYRVHKKHLNPKHLRTDSNVRNSTSDTLEYHGDIPAHHLEVHSEHDT